MEPFALYATIAIFFLTFVPFLKWLVKRIKLIRIIDRIPGPKAYPIIGTAWEFFGISRYDIYYVTSARTKQFPDIVRVWNGLTPEVRISKAEYTERIISSMQNIEKNLSYTFLHPWLGLGLLTSKDERWHKHRKIITPTFHFKILNTFCDTFADKTEILVKRLEKYADTNEVFDMFPYITRVALDIICQTAMGVTVNAQNDVEHENEYVRAVYAMADLVVHRITQPWLHYNFIFKHSELSKRSDKTLEILHGFSKKVIQERNLTRKQAGANVSVTAELDSIEFKPKERLAFLDILLDGNTNENNLSDDDIREEVDTFMFEGHDTTTAGISWALLLIGLHDDVQAKIAEELDSIFGDSDRPATIHDLNEMKYLERVIKETLRLYPSVASMGRTLSEDVQAGPYLIPKGTTIVIEIASIHRNPEHFPDPDRFDPDRFLPEVSANRYPYAYIPFSAGPRNCIGQKFAILEEKSVLSAILRKYKVKSMDKREHVRLWHQLILRPKDGIRMRIEKRTRQQK